MQTVQFKWTHRHPNSIERSHRLIGIKVEHRDRRVSWVCLLQVVAALALSCFVMAPSAKRICWFTGTRHTFARHKPSTLSRSPSAFCLNSRCQGERPPTLVLLDQTGRTAQGRPRAAFNGSVCVCVVGTRVPLYDTTDTTWDGHFDAVSVCECCRCCCSALHWHAPQWPTISFLSLSQVVTGSTFCPTARTRVRARQH